LSSRPHFSGDIRWHESLLIDLPYLDTLLNPAAPVLILFEFFQHPPSVAMWRQYKHKFAGDALRLAWAFLDTSSPEVYSQLLDAWQRRSHLPLQLQLFQYAVLSVGMLAMLLISASLHGDLCNTAGGSGDSASHFVS
jgi:hypothetical protein